MSEYLKPSNEHYLSKEDLKKSDKETQIEVMRVWFGERYEDPANRTPYESREGGYIYIWGGPYDAREELENEFSGTVPDEVIDEIVNELENECLEWSPTPSDDDYDDFDNYLIDDIKSISDHHHIFTSAISDIENLLIVEIDPSIQNKFYQLLYINVISTLEAYLSGVFIGAVLSDQDLKRSFLETTKHFQGKKILLSELFKTYDNLDGEIENFLNSIVWHNFERVVPLYKNTLKVNFPIPLSQLMTSVIIRHDIVHRNGKTKKGEEHLILKNNVEELIKIVEDFAKYIEEQLKKEPWSDF